MPKKPTGLHTSEEIDRAASETSDLGEDEYEVERIVKHRTAKGGNGYEYMIKWLNYPESQNTWESEENIGCKDLIKEYWDTKDSAHSGRQKRAKESEKNDTTPNRRKEPIENTTKKRKSTKSPEKKAKKSTEKSKPTEIVDERDEEKNSMDMESDTTEILVDEDYCPPEGTDWDDEVLMVESVEQRDGSLHAIVRWKIGIYTEHTTAHIADKCPKKLVEFYEARLKFTANEVV